jgi:glutamine amidotransferase
MITVIDHDFGNIGSVIRALKHLGIDFSLSRDLSAIEKSKKLILPGVGSFAAASEGFVQGDLGKLITHLVSDQHVPIFGFCLGMQLLGQQGEEMGENPGLGLIKGKVKKLRVNPELFAVPHMGWNDVSQNGLRMFESVPSSSCFYFVHSYELITDDPDVKVATVEYGNLQICAAVEKGHIWGAQFHPEKSQSVGLQLLKNFEKL